MSYKQYGKAIEQFINVMYAEIDKTKIDPMFINEHGFTYQIPEMLYKLQRLCNAYQKLQVLQLNQPLTDYQVARECALEEEIPALVKRLGLKGLSLDGDPRGNASVKIIVDRCRANSFGGDSLYCVPTSDMYL